MDWKAWRKHLEGADTKVRSQNIGAISVKGPDGNARLYVALDGIGPDGQRVMVYAMLNPQATASFAQVVQAQSGLVAQGVTYETVAERKDEQEVGVVECRALASVRHSLN